MQSIGARIAEARRRQFVGRSAEASLFKNALASPELPFCILYLYGTGGVGKTSLLQSFGGLCDDVGVPHTSLDARNMAPSPDAFSDTLRNALDLPETADPIAFLQKTDERRVLFLDTFELLDGMQAWLRDGFLTHISENVLVVAAGRQMPSEAWLLDSAWNALFHSVRLENFSPDESRAYLAQRTVPPALHEAAISFTHGHPLALSLLADLQAVVPDAAAALEETATPEIVNILLKRFIAQTPSALQKSTLELCSVVRTTNEALLREMLFPQSNPAADGEDGWGSASNEDVAALFMWLRGLSFVDVGPSGVFPHDIAREALLADLKWRDPDWFAELHRRARTYYIGQLQKASGEETQKQFLYDGVFLHRDSPIVRSAFTWQETSSVFASPLRPSDIEGLCQMVARYEGDGAVRAARHWFEAQPESVVVFRNAVAHSGERDAGEPLAFYCMLALHQMTSADYAADPAAALIGNYIKEFGPLRENEGAACLRFWMTRDTYQDASPLQSLLIVHALRHFLTRGQRLAYTFFCCQKSNNWQAVLEYADIAPIGEYLLDEKCCSIWGHDWRRVPLALWLERIGQKEIGGTLRAAEQDAPSAPDAVYLALTQAEFSAAVLEALRHVNRPDKLQNNPLLRSHLFAPDAASPAALKKLIGETSEVLNGPVPRAQRGYLALRHTYLTPAATQEDAADRLGLPFSTYRRHLGEGIAALTKLLWQKEING